MKRLTAIIFVALCSQCLWTGAGELNQEQIEQAITALSETLVQEGGALQQLGDLPTSTGKKNKLDQIIADTAGTILGEVWNNPDGGAWPIVDWGKVDGFDSFFGDQIDWIGTTTSIADSEEEMARLGVVAWLLGAENSKGEIWYEEWLLEKAGVAEPSNLTRLVFWATEDFGEDIRIEIDGETVREIDWATWKQAFNGATELGKAILLKNMTKLAARADGWDDLADIHLSVFAGNNEALMAIALIKGDGNLGDAVTAKWEHLAENATNPKLRGLAQEALVKHLGQNPPNGN